MEILIVAVVCLVMILGFILGLNIIDRRLEKNPSMKKKPSTLRPRDPPKGQRPQGHPGRDRGRPLTIQEDFWLPCVPSTAALGRLTDAAERKLKEAVARGVPRESVEWKCGYCGSVNHDVATCSNCGAPCQESERIEKLKRVGEVREVGTNRPSRISIVSPDKPLV